MRMPRPPPPADALTISGRSPSVGADGASRTGTPATAMIRLASTFEPIFSIDSGVGPTQTSPASTTARAKAAFSDRKP